jgi:hypothetical protein
MRKVRKAGCLYKGIRRESDELDTSRNGYRDSCSHGCSGGSLYREEHTSSKDSDRHWLANNPGYADHFCGIAIAAMPKFKKKPIELEAEQWFQNKFVEGVDGPFRRLNDIVGVSTYYGTITTPDGPYEVNPGDWIITEPTGEKFPCKPHIFEATYDPVEEEVRMSDYTIEVMAAYAHAAWSGWMRYLFSVSSENEDGSVTIPVWAVERWKRQMNTAYDHLPESEKESDRLEADCILRSLKSANDHR